MNALDNERESRATDMLLNYETVKYFCNEEYELRGYDTATRQYQVRQMSASSPGQLNYIFERRGPAERIILFVYSDA
jgi:ABC-type transport system involved in Fe-S cluster assembly fused permease/ATPase subunit